MKKKQYKTVAIVAILVILFGAGYIYYSNEKSSKTQTVNNGSVQKNNEEGAGSETLVLAKDAYTVAEDYAKKWSDDAVLINITNFRGSSVPDGTAVRWKVKFYSPAKDKDYSVHVVDGKFFQDLEEAHTSLDQIVNNWINSDTAVTTAKKYFDSACDNYWLGISGNKRAVKCDMSGGKDKTVYIDAQSGEFVSED